MVQSHQRHKPLGRWQMVTCRINSGNTWPSRTPRVMTKKETKAKWKEWTTKAPGTRMSWGEFQMTRGDNSHVNVLYESLI